MKFKAKLIQIGDSKGITIPIKICEAENFKIGDEVIISGLERK